MQRAQHLSDALRRTLEHVRGDAELRSVRRERQELALQVRRRIERDGDHLRRGREHVRVETVDDPTTAARE